MLTAQHAKECILAILLSAWFILTVVRQTRRHKPLWLNQIDIFRLIPTWRLFGPNPVTWDYRLHLRTRNSENNWSVWQDITPHKSRGKASFFWNPQRRIRKVFSTAARRIMTFRKGDIRNSWGYPIILSYVLVQPAESAASPRQFEISRCRILGSPEHREVVFRSEVLDPSVETVL
jgi:hypothetical protein